MELVVRGVSKAYGEQAALDGIDLTLTDGVVALLGANGSGKSTLLRLLATLIQPDSGEIAFNGLAYPQHERLLRAQIGYLPQALDLPETLTPRKLLNHLARLRGMTVDPVEQFQLQAIADQPFRRLSAGQQRLVGLAQAFLGTPRLLLLDEFTRGLDVVEREAAFRLIQQPGRLVVFSTHIPAEVESAGAETVIVLERGRVLFCDTVAAMRAAACGAVYELCAPADALPELMASRLVSRVSRNGAQVKLRVIGRPERANAASASPTLEDAYLFLTQR